MTLVNLRSGLFALFLLTLTYCAAQPRSIIRKSIAQVINNHLDGYGFRSDNLIRLAIYTELKGEYDATHRQILLDFGKLGKISFYQDNCLIRSGSITLNLNKGDSSNVNYANEVIGNLLEKFMLFSNHQAEEKLRRRVDNLLARKNLEPFHKVFTRHLLLRYGKYQPQDSSVIFHTDFIPSSSDFKEDFVQKHKTPLKLVLNDKELRGYYIKIGGEVYVNDSEEDLWYATEASVTYNNLTAYKLFIQHLLTETIPYISQEEVYRQKTIQQIEVAMQTADAQTQGTSLYQGYEWIGLMLNTLRTNGVSPADPYILKHLMGQNYFEKIYEQMTDEEQEVADQFKAYGWYLKE